MIGRHCSGIRTGGTDDSDALCHRESKILNASFIFFFIEFHVRVALINILFKQHANVLYLLPR